jgi:hypothetical protein
VLDDLGAVRRRTEGCDDLGSPHVSVGEAGSPHGGGRGLEREPDDSEGW